jgi:hypothetical protein
LKRSAQKTLLCWGCGNAGVDARNLAKVFCFFFSKKKCFLTGDEQAEACG